MNNQIDKISRLIARLAIAILIIFEFLNQFGILHFTLDFTWFGLSVTAILGWLVIEAVSYFVKRSCPPATLRIAMRAGGEGLSGWAMLVAAGAIYMDALGDILHLYGQYGWYDQMAHLAGGAAVAVLIFDVLAQLSVCGKIKLGLWWQSFFTISGAALFGALYEIEEYLEDFFTGSNRLGNGFDTANDLMLDIIGATLIVLIINFTFFLIRKRNKHLKTEISNLKSTSQN